MKAKGWEQGLVNSAELMASTCLPPGLVLTNGTPKTAPVLRTRKGRLKLSECTSN